MAVVVRSVRAAKDLIEIWHYIAEDHADAADRILLSIDRRIDILNRHPWSGRARADLGPGIRQIRAQQYLVFYRAGPDSVHVIRVLHERRRIGTADLVQ